MTPKEKAKELFDKYVKLSGIYVGDYENEKQMCLIVVDEILSIKLLWYDKSEELEYWQEVKQEIEQL